ncbi:MAG: UDP-N-acetylmuramate dehydrogenase [Erysipelotrichaceae bacterium]|nr:UDP-N-acetylmuramate dehydrogenase [Erysipelotrichaceae bacterium]
MNSILEQFQKFGDVDTGSTFHDLTTYKVGGPVDYVVYPNDSFSLQAILDICKDNSIPHKIMGHGSNMLCSEKPYHGAVIKLGRNMNKVYYDDEEVVVQAGYSIISLSYDCMKRSLSGLEFASGIPGTVGGCVFMNAGAYKKSMSDIITAVQVLKGNDLVWISNEECEFGYRTSVFSRHPEWIIVAAKLQLQQGNREEIQALMKERQERRFNSQPLQYPSAGSVFRNFDDRFAWQLVDEIGYRGKCYGDACVSEKHSNFIINRGNATADEILRLIEDIKKEVRERFGVEMVLEVERFNW